MKPKKRGHGKKRKKKSHKHVIHRVFKKHHRVIVPIVMWLVPSPIA